MFTKKILKKETKKLFQTFFHPTFIYLTVIGNSFLIAVTTAVYFLERNLNPDMQTYFDCLWWGISTITTIGYGDILPITAAGRVFAIILMYTGSVLFITFTGVVLTVLTAEQVEKELRPLEKEMKEEEIDQKLVLESLDRILVRLSQIEEKINNHPKT